MHKPPLLTSNFAHLHEHDAQLLRLGMLAERYFPDDPNTSLLKLRQLAELLAQLVATKVGLYQSPEESQYDLLRRLQDQGMLPRSRSPGSSGSGSTAPSRTPRSRLAPASPR